MRITVNLPKYLLAQADEFSRSSCVGRSAFIKDVLLEYISRKRVHTAKREVTLPTYGAGGVLPGVNIDDSASLLDIMDADFCRKLRDSRE